MIKRVLILLIILPCLSSFAQEITLDKLNKFVSSMEEKYQIKLYIATMPPTTWRIGYEFAQKEDYESLYNYLILFDKEFRKYPLSFLKKTKLEGLAFVKNLSIEARYLYDPVSAIPDYKQELLIYDFISGSHDKSYQRQVVHHEFYHMLEEQFNGNAKWKDPVWNSFNKNNNYYSGGRDYFINHPKKGFVSDYSLSALEEDKAEVFSTLFIKENYTKIIAWKTEDKILNKKVNHIKSFLKGIDRKFNDEYWLKRKHQ